MLIIVTGAVGIGKSTVCRRLVEILKRHGYTCGGILTYKAEDKGIIIEDVASGEKETLASLRSLYNGPRTPGYFFNPEGIDFGIRAIEKGTSAHVLFVDELGHLELRGEGFAGVPGIIRTGRVKHSILVIRSELLSVFLPLLPEPIVYEVTLHNRNELPDQIATALLEELTCPE